MGAANSWLSGLFWHLGKGREVFCEKKRLLPESGSLAWIPKLCQSGLGEWINPQRR